MWKRCTCFAFLIVSLALLQGGVAEAFNPLKDPALIGWWTCDEGTGTVVADSSPNGNHGAFVNGDPVWTTGIYGNAITLVGPTLVRIEPMGLSLSQATMAGWLYAPSAQPEWASIIMHRDPGPASGFNLLADRQLAYHWADASNTWSFRGNVLHPLNEWAHCAVTVEPDKATFYLNGVASAVNNVTHGTIAWDGPTHLGGDGSTSWVARRMNGGSLDDVCFFSRALTDAEILAIMGGLFDPALASNPVPADEATDVLREIVLSWTPGETAATHDVYLGTSFDDVNDASRTNPMGVLASQGQTATTYDPGRLEFGQTYFWRVDEVNAAPDNTIFTGEVWRFEVEPFAYAIANVIATSNGESDETSGPEKLVDGSGLNEADQHSVDAYDMWSADAPADGSDLYLQFEFDAVYKLHQILVWNYNVQFEMMLGFGLKNVTVEYSTDGEEWTVLGDYDLNQATARATYVYNSVIDFGGIPAKYVKLTVNSAFGTLGYGLSEVRFTHIPVQAREPQPADGAVNVDTDAVLSWRAGREAATHEVYFGVDAEELPLLGTSAQPSIAPGVLDLATTYYWKVVEVNDLEAIGAWEGSLWSFATRAFTVVEDFESYTDDIEAGEAIFDTWLDGWVNDTGSTVGHMVAPFAEQSIVHSGRQSMPMFYENTNGLTIAEAERTFPAQNWTASGIKTLSLYFYGDPGNTGQLYLKINGTKVPYDGDAADITRGAWQPWNVDLSTVGINLSSVTKLTIGIEGAGAEGIVYIDDIRLYPTEPEFVTPVEPDTVGLVARYAFDGNVNDSSGNGFHGTVEGNATYTAGVDGQAITLDGLRTYVVVETVGITGDAPRTISGWAKADTTTIPAWTNIFGFTGPGTNGQHFDIEAVGDSGANATLGYYGLHRHGWERNILPIDLEWHHLAATFDGTTVKWYGDGMLIGSDEADNVNTPGPFHIGKRQDNEEFFPGAVDEVRVYDRALSDGEIAWLAGRTVPLHKAF